jgi:hypothetical protein
MMGKFHDLVRASLEFDPRTFEALDPTILTIQLASWDIYLDWEKTRDGLMVVAPARRSRVVTQKIGEPEKQVAFSTIFFKPLIGAIEEYDEKHRRDERANPESFRVEYRSKWATGEDTYFDPAHIDRAFRPWRGISLEQLESGSPSKFDYLAHGDPGKTSSNFGFAIAHVVPDPDGHEIPHVVFDRVHAWTPGDFQTIDAQGEVHYEMDYDDIESDIKRWAEGFLFTDLSFDQWNSISFVQRLNRHMGKVSYKNSRVWERTTTAPINWMTAETMKVALSLDRVHMPYFELAELELKFLTKLPNSDKVDHPSSGPVTTKDVYDAISIVVQKAIGRQIASAYGEQFSALRVGTALPGLGSVGQPGSVTGEDTGRPLSTPAVQSLFNRDRNMGGRGGARPVPGQLPGHRPGRPR